MSRDKLFYQIGCDNMKVCVDSRERDKIPLFRDYIASKKSSLITGMEVGTYASGDASSCDGLVGFERKGSDFVESTYSGQLDKQLRELRNNFQYPFLFLEYDGIQDMIMSNLGVNPESLKGELTSIMARHRVTVLFVGRIYVEMVVRTLKKFYDGKNKTKEYEYTPIRRGGKRPVRRDASPQEVKLDIVSRIPKIGPKKGLQLLERFEFSIGRIANASVEEIMEVKGVGELLAQHIKEVLK